MIRAGMTVAEAILQLTKGFRKMMGRDPDGLEKIKIQQEAVKRIEEVNKVVDMEGNVIDTSKGIMGGKQIQDSPEFGARIRETYDKAKGPGKGQEMVDALKSPGAKKSYKIIEDQLGVKLYGDETFDEILEIQKTGKHPRGGPKIRNKKIVKDAIDNVSPGFVKGDRKYNAQLVAEDLADKKFGKEFYDLDKRQQMDLYDEALDGLSVDPEDMAQGGRAGFKDGLTPSFEDYLKERGMIEKRENLERLMREYQEDLRRKGVMEQKQMVAEGGRIGFKDGMTRRTFLKILGGAVSIPIIGKFLKPMKIGKTVTKVPMIKTDNVAGKPEWFDALVNKVIIEGDDVTKKFATQERQTIHSKTLDDGSVVRVTEDLDEGAVRVEYDSDANVFEDTVQLEYKKPLPDEGDPRPIAEFKTSESGPVGRGGSDPDGGDFEIDVDEIGGTSIRDLDSDVSILKQYATGKKPTMKEIVEIKKRKDKAAAISEDPEAQMDAVIARQGEYDGPYEDDFASGGIARMLGE